MIVSDRRYLTHGTRLKLTAAVAVLHCCAPRSSVPCRGPNERFPTQQASFRPTESIEGSDEGLLAKDGFVGAFRDARAGLRLILSTNQL